jgi:ATP-binding cassette subfamily B protein
MNGKMTLGSLVAFTAYLGLLIFPTLMFGFMLAVIQRGRASWKRILALFVEPTWSTGERALQLGSAAELKLTHASLTRGETRIIDDVSLTLAPGERLGIVGTVGSGKSTLLAMLARVLDVKAPGTYTIGGEDVAAFSLASIRAGVGYVPQQPFLFSATVRENVCFGKPDCDDLTLERALEVAAVKADVARFPDGLATEIGERGVTLSGGQKQRLAIARALVIDPKVLLLDDCFSAVDAETEKRIIDALLDHGSRKRSIVIATHRLAALDHVDRIIVMDRGRIVEEGTPENLQKPGTLYYELHKRQRLAERIAKAVSA